MGIGAILLILALIILVGLFVGRPFLELESETAQDFSMLSTERYNHERTILLAKSDQNLLTLQELDFDYKLGKIQQEDYSYQREILMKQGAANFRKLDEIDQVIAALYKNQNQNTLDENQRENETDEVSSKVQEFSRVSRSSNQTRRGVPASIADPDDDIEVMLAERRRVCNEKAAGFCPKCGGAVKKTDLFCPKCGEKII
jgi:chromosome segregation ATPase